MDTTIDAVFASEELLQKKADSTYFDRFAEYDYDDWKPIRQRFDFVNQYATGTSCLDVACGAYPVTAELSMDRLVGIDLSIDAKKKALDEGLDEYYSADFVQCEPDLLKAQLGTYDTIVASEFLEHIADPQVAIDTMAHLLNDEGRVLITVPNGRSIAGFVDKATNYIKGNGYDYDRFKLFHRTHVSCLKIEEWTEIFGNAGLKVMNFDYRPSDIVEGFPKETAPGWKQITKVAPNYLAHQYFFVLEKS